jgi:hypothetical protein
MTYRVLLECEEIAEVNLLSPSFDVTRPSARLVRALLWAALVSAGCELSEKQVGAKLSLRGASRAHAALLDAWLASMPKVATKPDAEGKPHAWPDSWAFAVESLGLTTEQWLDMTPLQVEALRAVYMERLQREEYLVGVIASTMANFGARVVHKPLKPESFMIHPFEAPDTPVTGEKLLSVFMPIKTYLDQKGKAS